MLFRDHSWSSHTCLPKRRQTGKPAPRCKRRGAVALEAAVVYSAFFLLLFAVILCGMGVFRYQQVACQAREVARAASVRGSTWAKETKQTRKTEAQFKTEIAVPLGVGM